MRLRSNLIVESKGLRRKASLLLLAVAALSHAATSASLSVGSGNAAAGATVSIPITFTSGTNGSAGLQWTLGLPAAVTSYTVQAGAAATAASKTLYCNGATCLLIGQNSTALAAGVVATISATLSSAASGSMPVTLTNTVATAAAGTSQAVSVTGGTITVPVAVAVSVTPASATLTASQQKQFTATVSGSSNTAVTWSLSPATGTISASGLYTAPANITTQQTVTIKATSAADTTKSATATVTLSPPASSSTIRVNAGGPAYTDSQGQVWAADYGYNGGSVYSTSTTVIGTTNPTLYQTERYSSGPLQYQFSVPNGNYAVTLKFAELYFNSSGSRVFNASINGHSVLANFDIYAEAGAGYKAVDETTEVAVSNGLITILLSPVVDNPKIDAIKIVPATGAKVSVYPVSSGLRASQTQQFTAAAFGLSSSGVTWSISPATGTISSSGQYRAPASVPNTETVTVKAVSTASSSVSGTATVLLQPGAAAAFTPIRVNAGGPAYTDNVGQVWAADEGYSGGAEYSITASVGNTTTPTLYESERYANSGSLTYSFSVPNGSYTVTLKFAELYFSTAGSRVFNVKINGTTVLTNFDIVAQAGAWRTAIDKSFPVTVSNGTISIVFTNVVNNGKIDAIQITAQ